MTIEQHVQALAHSQANLAELQKKLSQQPQLIKQEATQTFLFDLRDYLDSLSIITDFVAKQGTEPLTITEISKALTEQNQLVRTIITELEPIIEADGTLFDQKDGALRRMLSNLQGIVELNGLMLQDNLNFQRIVSDLPEEVSKPTEEKKSFLKRIFGK